jgi:hypothetical protein
MGKAIRLLSILIITLSPYCIAQSDWKDIDLHQIPQKKVRALVADLQKEKNTGFSQLESTWKPGQELNGYRELESNYYINSDLMQVWESYTSTSPAKSWNGKKVSFGLLISKYKHTILYRNEDKYPGVDTGQVIYLNLKILSGLFNLAVGFEIIDVDPVNRSISFSYLKGGKSSGQQTICFKPSDNGCTEIFHHTSYKCESHLRDRFLYPHFHRILINEFHRNMKNIILNSTPLFVPENTE